MCPLKGEMLEWLKRHAWKACIRQKCIAGSNPALSANLKIIECTSPRCVTVIKRFSIMYLSEI